MNGITGRREELAKLKEYYNSGKAEFAAVYGRRRVGKTFLIDACFGQSYDFYVSGVIEGTMDDQLYNFNKALKEYGSDDATPARNWNDAFASLKDLLAKKLDKKRVLLFIDELPCMDTPRSGFVKAIDSFWNTGDAINFVCLYILI